MEKIVLLRQDMSFDKFITWRKAQSLLRRKKADVLKYTDKYMRAESATFKIPKVLKLVEYYAFVSNNLKYNKKNILIRDEYQCGYCLIHQKILTIDHVIPKSKGGKSTFKNVVACCKKCNNKKGDRTPREAGMKLRKKLFEPSFYSIMKKRLPEDIQELLSW